MAKPNSKYILVAKCKKHPDYTAERKSSTMCSSCWLIYVMRWQHSPNPDTKLGSLNPYAYLIADVDLEDACSGIQLLPSSTAQA